MIMIGNVEIAFDRPPYYIADIAANHNGSLEHAYRLIELAQRSGAHAAKFQNFTASRIVSDRGFREGVGQVSHQAGWSKSVFETYQDASVPADWTPRLKAKCNEVGIEYMTSPYDIANVDWAEPYVNAYKIGSGDITWTQILTHIAGKGKPVLLATGASAMDDVRRAVSCFDPDRLVLMQCNTNYTARRENLAHINLRVLGTYAREFPGVILGLSDHLHGHATAAAAIALGARVIEKHFTDNNDQAGPDHAFSMTPNAFAQMVAVCDDVYHALGDGIKRVEDNERQTVIIQRRGLFYTRDMAEGDILSALDVEALRPALPDGYAPYEQDDLMGGRLARAVSAGAPVTRGDLV